MSLHRSTRGQLQRCTPVAAGIVTKELEKVGVNSHMATRDNTATIAADMLSVLKATGQGSLGELRVSV